MGAGRFDRMRTPNAPTEPPKLEAAYPFDQALKWLKGGRKVCRHGWNGKGMFIYLVDTYATTIGQDYDTEKLASILGEGNNILRQARIDMKFANGEVGIWTPTHEDMLSEDWSILQ